jgi:plastocyanin
VTPNAPRRVDRDGDGYDDPDPLPDPSQVPAIVTVNIVGTFGTGAFVPNPLQASIGNTIVWTNADAIAHQIVLDDSTPVGMLAPGQSSAPVALTRSTTNYRCTIHPSMTGQITDPAAPPPDPSQAPVPDPYAQPEPSDPYSDPYDYLRLPSELV